MVCSDLLSISLKLGSLSFAYDMIVLSLEQKNQIEIVKKTPNKSIIITMSSHKWTEILNSKL